MPNLLIGADVCPIERNSPCFKSGDAKSLFHDLLPEFQAADLSVVNLECPLIERSSPILKTGPVFGEDSACINGIKQAGIHVLSLANNHIMDHGPAGLKNTLEVCAKAGLRTAGAGANLASAGRILITHLGKVRLGILALAEHEFSIAGPNAWGANPLDLIEFVRTVKRDRHSFDYLLVLLHGAHEFQAPTPRIRNICRFMIEMGANTVVVQHPHCLGGYEPYQHGHIIYGQGALILDEAAYRDAKPFHEGFLIKLSIAGDLTSTIEFVPYTQSDPAPGARKLSPERAREFQRRLAERSAAIRDDAFVESEWRRFCDARKHQYLSALLGHNRILRKLNARGLIERIFYGKRRLLAVRNVVLCDTHREALETIFDQRMI